MEPLTLKTINVENPKRNPFERRTVGLFSSPRRTLKTLIISCTLLPLRIIFCVITLTLAFFLGKLINWGLPVKAHLDPREIPWWKKKIITWLLAKPLARLLCFVAGYHWVTEYGKMDEDVTVVILNHVAPIDGIFMIIKLFGSGLIEMNEFNDPIIGPTCRALSYVGVDKHDKASREQAFEIMKKITRDPLIKKFMMYPEGGCTNGSGLMAFKSGVFKLGLPVQPMFMRYWKEGDDYDPANLVRPSEIVSHIIRGWFEWSNRLELHWLPVYHPSEAELKDPELYARNVRAKMAEVVGVPTSEHTYEDSLFLLDNRKHKWGIPEELLLVEYDEFRKFTKMPSKKARRLLAVFARCNVSKTGLITETEFKLFFRLEQNEAHVLFSAFDLNKTKTLNFKKFLLGMAWVERLIEPPDFLDIKASADELLTLSRSLAPEIKGCYTM